MNMDKDDKIAKLLQSDKYSPSLDKETLARIVMNATAEFERTKPVKISFFDTLKQRIVSLSQMNIALPVSALAAVILCVFLIPPKYKTVRTAQNDVQQEKYILAQFNEVFGEKLQAIISVNDKTQIVLGDKTVSRAQPIVIRIQDGENKIKIVSFSGQNLQVTVGDKLVNFDALVDSQGKILLVGDDLFWESGQNSIKQNSKLHVSAENLDL